MTKPKAHTTVKAATQPTRTVNPVRADDPRHSPTKELTGGATVTVASRLPFDLKMTLHDFHTKHEPILSGGVREFKMAEQRRGSPTIILIGNSFPQNKGPGKHQQIDEGFALTHNVPKDFWDEWRDQQREADYLVNGLIFAHAERASLAAEITDKRDVRSGLERIDPAHMPVAGVETSEHFRRAS